MIVAPDGLTGRALFAHVAPFLERCHRERKTELREIAVHLRSARQTEIRLQQLVAHRELQELRAGRINNRRYVRHRANKLDRARADLERVRERIRELEAS